MLALAVPDVKLIPFWAVRSLFAVTVPSITISFCTVWTELGESIIKAYLPNNASLSRSAVPSDVILINWGGASVSTSLAIGTLDDTAHPYIFRPILSPESA